MTVTLNIHDVASSVAASAAAAAVASTTTTTAGPKVLSNILSSFVC